MDDEKNTAMMNDEKKASSCTEHWRDPMPPHGSGEYWVKPRSRNNLQAK